MKQFKNYLETQLNITKIKLKNIIAEIENLPDPQNIDITSFGTKEELKKMYIKDLRPNFLKRIIGPTKLDLQIHLKNKEHQRLYNEKRILERIIDQIKQTLEVINEQGIHGYIWPNDEIIKLMLEYASTNNVNPEELLIYLVQLFKNTKENDKVEDKIKKNIARFFNENYKILPDTKLSTLTLLFDKLFMTILNKEEANRYDLVINQIMVQLKVEKDKVTKKDIKPELELKRRALRELQEYLKGDKIDKTIDLKNFQLLLDTAEIPKRHQEKLLKEMELKIQEENKELERKQVQDAILHYLSESQIEVLKQGEQLASTSTGDIRDLLNRAIKDVISMCKYLSYIDQIEDLHESLEILDERIKVLKSIIYNVKEENTEPNSLFYVTDKEGVPILLRNLEIYELTDYPAIFNLLYKTATNIKGKKFLTKENIDFYYFKSHQVRLIYAEIKGIRIVVGIDGHNPTSMIKKFITNDIITKIQEIEHHSISKEYKEIHATYENVILESLNIKEPTYTLSLKRKEE